MNIYQKMAAITAEIGVVAKNLQVDAGKGSYKAVSERDILDAVKPLEAKYGIYSYPASRRTLDSQILEKESEYQGKVKKTTSFYTRIETVYRFVNVDEPTEFVETTAYSVGIDAQDKGDGKAMTYGDKYAIMKAYKISTGDDPDQTGSQEEDYSRRPREDRRPQEEFRPTCADCGVDITDREHDWSVKNFGRPLCRRCQSKAR